jgi:polyisoprenoid-binding protein YceI
MRPVLALVLLAALGAGTPAVAADWHMLPQGSRLGFVVHYEGAEAPGVFRQFTAVLRFDPGALRSGHLEIRVVTASADMDSAEINEAIAGPDWLDSRHHPQAQFLSSQIAADGTGGYLATGILDLKGKRRRLTVPFHWERHGDRARLQGRVALDRTQFGIGSGEWAAEAPIAHQVLVEFGLELIAQ